VIAHGPPLPFIDTAWHGRPVVDHIAPMAYAHWQQLQDPGAPRGHYYYWKTANYAALSDRTLGELAAMADRLPTMRSEIHVQHMGGTVARVDALPGTLPNFADQDDSDVKRRFGLHADQLDGMRRKYDPAGILLGCQRAASFMACSAGIRARAHGRFKTSRIECLFPCSRAPAFISRAPARYRRRTRPALWR